MLTNGDVVVIVDHDQVAKLQVTSQRSRLAGNTLLSTSITEEGICVVVDQLVARLVELSSGVCLCNGKTNGVGETLTQGTGGDLNSGGVVGFWVSRGAAVDVLGNMSGDGGPLKDRVRAYTEIAQVVDRKVVAEEVEKGVL